MKTATISMAIATVLVHALLLLTALAMNDSRAVAARRIDEVFATEQWWTFGTGDFRMSYRKDGAQEKRADKDIGDGAPREVSD
jgi:hypothetical protein